MLELLVAGRSNKEIGQALGIEERTVKAHVAKLMRKVGVQNRIAPSVHAITNSSGNFQSPCRELTDALHERLRLSGIHEIVTNPLPGAFFGQNR